MMVSAMGGIPETTVCMMSSGFLFSVVMKELISEKCAMLMSSDLSASGLSLLPMEMVQSLSLIFRTFCEPWNGCSLMCCVCALSIMIAG